MNEAIRANITNIIKKYENSRNMAEAGLVAIFSSLNGFKVHDRMQVQRINMDEVMNSVIANHSLSAAYEKQYQTSFISERFNITGLIYENESGNIVRILFQESGSETQDIVKFQDGKFEYYQDVAL